MPLGKILSLLKQIRWYLVFAFVLWFIAFLFGFYSVETDSTPASNWGLGYEPNINSLKLILLNNIKVIFTNSLGFLTLGILTFFNTAINGYFLGNIIKVALYSISLQETLLAFLPHSFEIFGIILSSAVGFQLTHLLFKTQKMSNELIWQHFKNSLLLIVLSVTIIISAAFIETFVTLNLIQ